CTMCSVVARRPARFVLAHPVAVFSFVYFFFQAEDGIRDFHVTGVSDVCSSDLLTVDNAGRRLADSTDLTFGPDGQLYLSPGAYRSEERRVGKERRCRGWPYH